MDEAVLVDPSQREMRWLRLIDGEYRRVDRSELLSIDVADIIEQIDWRPTA